MTVPGPLAQLRRLVPPFFARFFESESTDGADDPKLAFFALVAILAVPGFLLPLLLAGASHPTPGATIGGIDPADMGWSMIAHYQGVEALRAISRADKTFYLGFAMIASAIISVIVWNVLLLDRRDRIVLGPLPVRQTTLVVAKLIALAAYVAAVAVAMHTLASLTFGIALAANNTFGFAIRGIAAHFVAAVAASAFVMFAAIGMQGVTLTLLGPRWFLRVSPLLQFGVVGLIVIGVLTVPAMSQATSGVLEGTAPYARSWMLAPPLWFLGLYERVLGTSHATLIELSRTAVVALAATGAIAVGSFVLASRRVSTLAARPRWSALVIDGVAAIVSRDPQLRAVAKFFLTTIARSHRHRLVLASALGAAAAWGLPAWLVLLKGAHQPEAGLLSSGLAVPLFLLLGLRVAAWMPIDLRAAWVFELPAMPWETTRRVMERTMLVAAVLPAVLLFGILYWWLWGIAAALFHVLFTVSVATLVIEAVLWRFEGAPCTRPWNREVLRLRNAWPAYLAVVMTVSRGLPEFERLVLSRPIMSVCFSVYVLLLASRIRAASRPLPTTDEPIAVLTSALRGAALTAPSAAAHPPDADMGLASPPQSAPLFLGSLGGQQQPAAEALVARDALVILRPSRVVRDVRLALRRLASAPTFTLFSIVTLGAGVGLTTGVYSVVHAALWNAPPVRDIDRVVDLHAPNGRSIAAFSWPDFEDAAARQTAFSGLAAATVFHLPFVAGDVGEVVYGEAVNGSFFATLGIRPAAGRLIQPLDDRREAPRVAVLSYALWRLRFGSDPAVVGRTVRIDGGVYEIVGVAPPGFRGWDFSNLAHVPAVWVPFATAPDEIAARIGRTDRRFAWLVVKGRLAEGLTIEQASAQLATIGRALEAEYPTPGSDGSTASRFGRRWYVSSSRLESRLEVAMVARMFVCMVAAVLLIGCTNIANLAIARGASREHELAVRRALGASRIDLVREQLAESLIVAAASGFVATAIIRLTTTRLSVEIPAGAGQFIVLEPHLNLPVLLFAAGAGLSALATFAVWPALHLTRTPARGGLTTGGAATAPHWRLHRRLIGCQVGASVTLLLLAAACVNAIVVHALHDTGVDVDRLAFVSIGFETNRYDAARAQSAVDAVLTAVSHHPEVTAAAAAAGLPFGVGSPKDWSAAPADAGPDKAEPIQLVPATSGIFRTLGVRLLHGGVFVESTAPAQRVAIVNESFAIRQWGAADVVGRTLRLSGPGGPSDQRQALTEMLTIVGVVADTDVGRTGSREHGVVYVPLEPGSRRMVLFAARTDGDPRTALMALRAALRQVDPNIVVGQAATGMMFLAGQYVVLGFVAAVISTLGGVALLLAMSGLFGVVSHVVARRTRELAVRIALGAERSRIMRLVFADGLRPVIDGLALGLFGGAVCRSIVGATMTSSVAAVDPIAFFVVPAIFVATALGACYWPARRASRVDPNVALRES